MPDVSASWNLGSCWLGAPSSRPGFLREGREGWLAHQGAPTPPVSAWLLVQCLRCFGDSLQGGPGQPPRSAPNRAWGLHSPIKGILVGIGHVHDVHKAPVPCREEGGGTEGRGAHSTGAGEAWAPPRQVLQAPRSPSCPLISPPITVSPAEPATMALSFLLCLKRNRKRG